ncbi:MAG: hypothetical protein O3A95_04335 [Planctomycetota bacterium]|nr:hypothetical protein [Planctomycetota bacterium]MDA1113512.1 hypothetical protein [Planctomycetota bacterium]
MRRLTVLLLASAWSCQAVTLEDGDTEFRRANFHKALNIYTQLPADDQNAARIERTRYFLMEQNTRELLHLSRPEDAATMLDFLTPITPADRAEELLRLRARTELQISERYYNIGYEYSEANNPEAASEALRVSLSWNPNHENSQKLLVKTDDWLEVQEQIGEDFYFQGMEHLRTHEDLRARTSFMHAASMLGEESLAQSRLEGVTLQLAEESRALGRMYLEAGLTGPAWVAILDSMHLDPTNSETMELVQAIEDQVHSEAALSSADLATRGGAVEAAYALLAEARVLGVTQHLQRLVELSEANQDAENQKRYRRARAYELDNQMVHAYEQYQAIKEDEGGFGWEDVLVRIQALESRLGQAGEAYDRAISAEAAGNQAVYAEALTEALHLSVDFKDVRARFLALPSTGE